MTARPVLPLLLAVPGAGLLGAWRLGVARDAERELPDPAAYPAAREFLRVASDSLRGTTAP